MYGDKIRMIREMRAFSQEDVADKLGIKQNMCSKIETNQTHLTAEMLDKLSKALDVSPLDIMNQQPAIVNFQPSQATQQSIGCIENLVAAQKELFEKLIAAKDSEIARLERIIQALLGIAH